MRFNAVVTMEDQLTGNISCCHCVVCGGDCVVTIGDSNLSSVVDLQKLFSIFLRCVCNNNDDFDSNTVSEQGPANCNNNNDSVFCMACKHALIEWDKLYETHEVISQNLNRIRFTLCAKILSNSVVSDESSSHVENENVTEDVNDGQCLLFVVRKIQEVKDQVCRQFKPRVTLDRISSGTGPGAVSKDFDGNNSFEDEFKAFSQPHNDDDWIDYLSEPDEDPLSVENNVPLSKIGTKRSKTFPYKAVGPGKFLYGDKYIFFFNDGKYECAECSAVIIKRNSMFRHIREVHMKDVVKPRSKPVIPVPTELNYLGYHVAVDEDGSYCCPVCDRKRKKRSHMYQHIREAHVKKKQPARPKAVIARVKPDLTLKIEQPVYLPVKVEGVENSEPTASVVPKFESNPEKVETFSNTAEDHSFVESEEHKVLPTDKVQRRSLRERRRIATVVDLVDDDDDDEVISDAKQVGADDDKAGHNDDEWELNSEGSGDDDEQFISLESEEKDKPRKRNRKDAKGYSLVSSGPNEWIYADKYPIMFNSEEDKYYCGLCAAVNSRRAGLMKHIRDKHIDGQPTRAEMVLRPTGSNEYTYRDRFKITVKDDEWYCDECGMQRKDKTAMMNHIRDAHIYGRKRTNHAWRTFEEVAPNEFLYHEKYAFRFDPIKQLYLCSLCEYTCHSLGGVLPHIRGNHFTETEKQHHTAVEVAPGEYLYAGKYKIIFQGGRFCCTLCSCTREELYGLYPHFRLAHPDLSDEVPAVVPPRNLTVPQDNDDNGDAQKSDAPDANQSVSLSKAETARLRRIERRRVRRATSKGWKVEGDGKWTYKEWEVMEKEGKYKCLSCDIAEGERTTVFRHVQTTHAKETRLTRPPIRLRPEEGAVLEYMGIPYTYDPIDKKYACSLCHVKKVCRRKVNQHIKYKHIHPEKFICDICGQEFDCRLGFQQHRARHEGPKYACKHCDKRFTDMNYLRTHMRIHIGEDAKKHQCEFCGRKFYTQKELRNHRSSHTGEKVFPCDMCGESFATTFKRREHRKKFHGGLPQKPKWKPTEDVVPAELTAVHQAETEAHTAAIAFGSVAPTDGQPT